MRDKLVKVDDLPGGLREACLDRGLREAELITPLQAVKEWSIWHLGDESWAESIITMYEMAQDVADKQ